MLVTNIHTAYVVACYYIILQEILLLNFCFLLKTKKSLFTYECTVCTLVQLHTHTFIWKWMDFIFVFLHFHQIKILFNCKKKNYRARTAQHTTHRADRLMTN